MANHPSPWMLNFAENPTAYMHPMTTNRIVPVTMANHPSPWEVTQSGGHHPPNDPTALGRFGKSPTRHHPSVITHPSPPARHHPIVATPVAMVAPLMEVAGWLAYAHPMTTNWMAPATMANHPHPMKAMDREEEFVANFAANHLVDHDHANNLVDLVEKAMDGETNVVDLKHLAQSLRRLIASGSVSLQDISHLAPTIDLNRVAKHVVDRILGYERIQSGIEAATEQSQ